MSDEYIVEGFTLQFIDGDGISHTFNPQDSKTMVVVGYGRIVIEKIFKEKVGERVYPILDEWDNREDMVWDKEYSQCRMCGNMVYSSERLCEECWGKLYSRKEKEE